MFSVRLIEEGQGRSEDGLLRRAARASAIAWVVKAEDGAAGERFDKVGDIQRDASALPPK
jgi:hypothetical protein